MTYGDTVVDWAAVTRVKLRLEGAELSVSIWVGMFRILGTNLPSFSLFDSEEIMTTSSSVVEVGARDAFPLFRWFNTREDRSGLVAAAGFPLSEAKSSTVRGIGGTGVLSSLESGPGRAAALDVYKIFTFLSHRKYLTKKFKKIYKCVDSYLHVYQTENIQYFYAKIYE